MDGMLERRSGLPSGAGVGYKPQHLEDILASPGSVSWLEIHAENYMVDGGPQLAGLRRVAEKFPISCHGVGPFDRFRRASRRGTSGAACAIRLLAGAGKRFRTSRLDPPRDRISQRPPARAL